MVSRPREKLVLNCLQASHRVHAPVGAQAGTSEVGGEPPNSQGSSSLNYWHLTDSMFLSEPKVGLLEWVVSTQGPKQFYLDLLALH